MKLLDDSVAEPIEENVELEELEESGFEGLDSPPAMPHNHSVERTPSLDKERDMTPEDLNRRYNESIATKRSFLVRMVSDPKCYNPKIVRHLHSSSFRKISQDMYRDRTLMQSISYRPARLGSSGRHTDSPIEDDDEVGPPETVSQTGVQTPI